MSTKKIFVGITGASGAVYAQRLMQELAAAGVAIHLSVSSVGRRLLADELGIRQLDADALTGGRG